MIKCLAIDDEPLALAQLTNYISLVPFFKLIKKCSDTFEAMQIIAEEEIDLIFTDIQMPDLSGIDFIRSLSFNPLVVFTTAYPEYAIESFKLEVTDYLLKPFDFQDFLKATDKVRRQWEQKQSETIITKENLINEALFIQSEEIVYRLPMTDICYIESRGTYVKIFMEDAMKPIITLSTLHEIEEKLMQELFMRVHQSYIINLRKIREISRFHHLFIGDKTIPIDENHREKFSNYIKNRCIGK